MEIEFKSYTKLSSLISAIIFFILGAIMFTSPDVMVIVISRILGGTICIIGIFNCIKNYLEVKRDNSTPSTGMVTGILGIIIGLVFIFLAGVIEALIRFVIGGFILFIGINKFINVLYLKKNTSKFFVLFIISLILLIGGLYTILEVNLAFQAIGIILMIYALLEIFSYIFCKRESNVIKNKNEKVIDAVIIRDNTKKKSSKD